MDQAQKLRDLASWYREFADRAENPAIWDARLRTAEDLEREAEQLESRQGRYSESEHLRVLTLLALLRLPLRTDLSPVAIFDAMQGDKKRRNRRLRFVLPRAIGDVESGVTCTDASVRWVLAQLARDPGVRG